MLGLLAPTFVAVIAALSLGGSLRQLFTTRVCWWPAVLISFAVELVLYNPPVNGQAWAIQVGPSIWLVTKLVLLAVLLRNAWPAPGPVGWPWLVAAVGVALNALVIALNDGHMPQAPEAAIAVWGQPHRSDQIAERRANGARDRVALARRCAAAASLVAPAQRRQCG
jgi:hypothetical protein